MQVGIVLTVAWSMYTSGLQRGRNRPPEGDFMRCGGDFVICEIWGAISVSRGAISAG